MAENGYSFRFAVGLLTLTISPAAFNMRLCDRVRAYRPARRAKNQKGDYGARPTDQESVVLDAMRPMQNKLP
jgi:hypothetical protein